MAADLQREADRAWCRQHFASMADGAVWAVPRSGLIFTRRGEKLILTDRMPWTEDLAVAAVAGMDVPPTATALRVYQDADAELIRVKFAEAGITVEVPSDGASGG